MRKRWRWVMAGLAVALLALAPFVLWSRPDRVTVENFSRIKNGMSRAEVYAILGLPGDYRTGPTNLSLSRFSWRMALERAKTIELQDVVLDIWQGDTACVGIAFASSDLVDQRECEADHRLEQPYLANLVWRVKRQWRRWFPDR